VNQFSKELILRYHREDQPSSADILGVDMNSLPAPRALDQYFLEARCKLLDLAAILDRIGRGDEANAVGADPRLARIAKALATLSSDEPNKAELIQQIFSLEYDPSWKRPKPRF
jgi:hypothetical protein